MLSEANHHQEGNGSGSNDSASAEDAAAVESSSRYADSRRENEDGDDYVAMSNKIQTSDSTMDVEYSFQPSEYSRENFRSHLIKLASFHPPNLAPISSSLNDNYSKFLILT
jgi:hypothetical protein